MEQVHCPAAAANKGGCGESKRKKGGQAAEIPKESAHPVCRLSFEMADEFEAEQCCDFEYRDDEDEPSNLISIRAV